MRLVVAYALFAVALVFTAGNWSILYRWYVHRQRSSMLHLVGGAAGLLACLLHPALPWTLGFAFVVADPGTIGFLGVNLLTGRLLRKLFGASGRELDSEAPAPAPDSDLTVFVQLLDEGSVAFRPTQASYVTATTVRLHATPDYDPEDETWEFPPGSIVEVETRVLSEGEALVATGEADSQDDGDKAPAALLFLKEEEKLDEPSSYVAVVPGGVETKALLLPALAQSLRLPTYFGHNWDALAECLRDFHWISCYRIVLVHNDLPGLPVKELRVYLDVLSHCTAFWNGRPEHEFVVAFPNRERERVLELIS